MNRSQKLLVFIAVLFGGLGLALFFRQADPENEGVTQRQESRVEDDRIGSLSLSIEAGNDADLPSPLGSTPFYGAEGEIFEGARVSETPVLRKSPSFQQPRPLDPPPKIGNQYEPLLKRRPLRDRPSQLGTTATLQPQRPTDSLAPTQKHHEFESNDPVSSREIFHDSSSDEGQVKVDPRAEAPIASLAPISKPQVNDDEGTSIQPSHSIDPPNELKHFDSGDASRRQVPASTKVGEQPHVDDQSWTVSPRLRGWRETRIARVGHEPRVIHQRSMPFTSKTRVHRLRDGDTLPKLALRYLGDESRHRELFEMNRDVLHDPQILPLGIKIRIPNR